MEDKTRSVTKGSRRVVKKKNKKINPVIYLLICSVLLFAIYNSISVFVLGFFGETTVGAVTSYDSRLDDRNAEANRSRTVSKGYRFNVNGKEYKGYVIYKSDEAWPNLSEGEVRRESISYLEPLPYINKPAMLVDIDEIGPVGFIYHIMVIPGCILLLLLVNGRLGKRKKRVKKTGRKEKLNTRRKNTMACTNCGGKLPEGAAFCVNCGTPVHKAGGDVKGTPPQTLAPSQGDLPPKDNTVPVGWSSKSSHPEILEAAYKNKKFTMGCAWIFMLLFPIGFLLAGLFMDDMPLNEAIIIGVGLGAIMLIINLVRIKGMKRPVWEGVVAEKFHKKRQRHRDDTVDTYTEYTTVIKTDAGKKKRIIEKDSGRHMYDYLSVGDRVRYYPAFETYEKYDKSRDKIIYCNVCSMMNKIEDDRCKRCNNLLFK